MTGDRSRRLDDNRLYLIATVQAGASQAGVLETVEAAVRAGVGLVQVRVKGAGTDTRRTWLARFAARLGPDVLLIVNDDLEAAFTRDGTPLADGLHLGREDAAALVQGAPDACPAGSTSAGLALARQRLGPERLLGTSVRTLAELETARQGGADHVGFGAMAPSPTRPDATAADPLELARCVAAHPGFPIFPLGGLHAGNVDIVLRAGCRRAAVGSGILAAPDPAAAVRALLSRLHRR